MSNRPKELRRQSALSRQQEYDKLSTQQKLQRLQEKLACGLYGEAKRQIRKLLKKLEEENKSNSVGKKSGK
jgi:hypothetical protein